MYKGPIGGGVVVSVRPVDALNSLTPNDNVVTRTELIHLALAVAVVVGIDNLRGQAKKGKVPEQVKKSGV
ncbi:hypothetical protein HYFRA_00003633 [Hymenoscyphus fraxineus]|uniref:Uncharacterized protein n=1 Tax=Hymenoscyphus fraxineus TaxID=746836 RepID=A0A9N9L0W4_9HELO|nr:hypothetical protein HYFRA_00003633 [Hymenoscyphus fraxineus]